MTHPNRVQPDGTFLATPARGLLLGNRGVLHDETGTIGPARWKHRNWVCCALTFKGRHRTILQPRTWTELFFLDEAVALAAGHRPCAECRRADYDRYRRAWAQATGTTPSAPDMDRALHAARAVPGGRMLRQDSLPAKDLPNGTFIRENTGVKLIWNGAAYPHRPDGYCPARPLPSATVQVLTPAPTRAVLAAGYVPLLHPSLKPL